MNLRALVDALLAESESDGARALHAAGVPQSTTVAASQEQPAPAMLMNTLLAAASGEAYHAGHRWIGTIHLVLALSRPGDLAVAVVGNPVQVRTAALALIERGDLRESAADVDRPRTKGRAAAQAMRDEAVVADRVPAQLEAVPTHRDRPAAVDELRRRDLAEVLADRIRRARGEDTEHPGEAPRQPADEALLVHVHAPWGMGKSSLLGFVREELEQPADARLERWVVVEFDAWQHQRVAPPWWWLLAAIRREGLAALRRRLRARAAWFLLRDLGWRLWNARPALIPVAAAVALVLLLWRGDVLAGRDLASLGDVAKALAAIVALLVTAWGLLRTAGRWIAFGSAPPGARVLERVHDPMRASQRRFRFLVEALGSPLCLVVENLDRCRPDYVVELLEGIQTLFLDRPVTYVVAADREWLCESFRSAYETFDAAAGDPGRPLGHLFLEKTFQISIEIPPLRPDVRDAYWRRLLRTDAAAAAETPPAAGLEARAAAELAGATTEAEVEAVLQQPAASEQELESRRRAAVRRLGSPELERDLAHALERFAPLVERNPRAMKRLVNAYGVERALRVRSGQLLDERERIQNVLWIVLRLRWPRLADHLARRPDHAAALIGGQVPADGVPEELRPLFGDADVRRLLAGEGLRGELADASADDGGVPLDEQAVRRFIGSGTAPSSAGA